MNSDPPRLAERALRRLLPRGPVGDSIAGDLHEEHARLARGVSVGAAALWYRRQALALGWRCVCDRLRGHGPLASDTSSTIGAGRRGDGMMTAMLRAARYGAKGLARSPQFTLAAVITLALAIGTNTAVFSVVQGVLLKPLPYEDADELVLLGHTAPGLGYDEIGISPGFYLLYSGESDAFRSSGMYTEATANITGDDAPPTRVVAARVSRELFATLGVTPAAGRTFDEAEMKTGGPPAVLLSHGLWRERFGADHAVVGTTVRIDGVPRTVVGVMPDGFEFPDRRARLWLPLVVVVEGAEQAFGDFAYQAVARLDGGMDAAGAEARLRPLMQRVPEIVGAGSDFAAFIEAGRLATVVTPLKEAVVGDVSRLLWILLGAVAFVFLIACANVTNLFLVRAEARQKEFAVRAARLHAIAIDPVVLAFTVVATLLAAVLLGMLPALRLTSPDLLATLGRSARGATAGRERHRTRQSLVVAQTALALVLLVGSGLMVRSFQNIRAIDPGFEPRDATTFRVSLPESTYPDAASLARFHTQLLERLRGLSGVEQAGATTHAPLAGCCSGTAHIIEDQPLVEGGMPPMFWFVTVTDGYFKAMRIPIVAGRAFGPSDGDEDRRNVVVSEALAARAWPGVDPIGRRLRPAVEDSLYTVVGVAGNVREQTLERDAGETVYYPVARGAGEQARNMTYVIRTDQPGAIATLARTQVAALDPNLPVAASATYEKIVADSMVRLSFTMLALVAAAGIALVLGAIGLYSVISYIVARRTNEIGIRLALGARPAEVRRMVVLQGARLVAIGLIIGVAAALALTRLLQGLLFGTASTDPLTFVAVSGILGGIALFAAWLPAVRASRIDPASSLNAD